MLLEFLFFSEASSSDLQAGHLNKKPSRPCVFCGGFQSQLKRHIIRKHGHENSVQAALKLPKAEQNRAFEALRKEGIYKKNVELIHNNEDIDLIRERKQGD